MGLCGSKDDGKPKARKAGKKDHPDHLHGHNAQAGLMVYLPTTGPLTAKEYKERLTSSEGTQTVYMPKAGFTVRYAFVSQRGYYPDSPYKANQDTWAVHTYFGGDPEQIFFGIFDGHGEQGDKCATFARDKVAQNLSSSPHFQSSPETAFHQAMVLTNNQLHRSDEVDDSMSGTTAINVLLRGRSLYVANVGDSRAVLAERRGGRIVAHDLSYDQTPYREDERERVKKCGARVLTLDQLEGLKDPNIDNWGADGDDDGGDPPRLWAPNATYPGTAFTRSIGDNAAERIGVFAEPECVTKKLLSSHPFVVIASDGVFEFLPSQSVVDMVSKFDDPQEACYSVVAESYRLWLQHETRTDDITMIVLQLHNMDDEAPAPLPTPPPAPPSASQNGATTANGSNGSPTSIASSALPMRRLASRLQPIDMAPSPSLGSFRMPPLASAAFGSSSAAQNPVLAELQPAPLGLSPEERSLLDEAVHNNFLFTHLDPESRQRVFDVMERRPVQAGEQVIRQGEQGNHFYIVDHGTFDVWIQHDPSEPMELIHTYTVSGTYRAAFGELALLYSKPRAASVVARTEGSLWMLHRDAFKAVLQRHGAPRSIALSLRGVELLQSLNMAQLQTMADAMDEMHFNAGDSVVRQGERGHEFFIVILGELARTLGTHAPGSPPDADHELPSLTAGHYFGELALQTGGAARVANVVAASDRAVLLRLARSTFEGLFGPLQARSMAQATWRSGLDMQKDLVGQRGGGTEILQPSFRLKDLSARGLLHATDCAALMLFEVPARQDAGPAGQAGQDGEVYTVRVISITDVMQQGKQALVMRARELTRSIEPSLFVPSVMRTFKDDSVLAEVLHTVGLCTLDCLVETQHLDEESAAFVAASVILGLEHLHWSEVIYRGLALPSVLVTEAGQIQLVDFRFARRNEGRTHTLCGNPEYLAPEVVENRGHDESVDLWSLGIFIYALLAGGTPFYDDGDDELQIYRNILARQLLFPDHMSAKACDLVDKLLCRAPAGRLGALPGGWAALKAHSWFQGIDWEALQEHRFPPPAGLQDRIYEFEGIQHCPHFEPRPAAPGSDTAWCKDF